MKLDALHRVWADIRAVWRELTAEEQSARVCEKPYRSTDPTTKVATQLKWMLLRIYLPQVAFELRVTMHRPKSRMGYYMPAKRSITIHGGWGDVHSLKEILSTNTLTISILPNIVAVARRIHLTDKTSGASTRHLWQKR